MSEALSQGLSLVPSTALALLSSCNPRRPSVRQLGRVLSRVPNPLVGDEVGAKQGVGGAEASFCRELVEVQAWAAPEHPDSSCLLLHAGSG